MHTPVFLGTTAAGRRNYKPALFTAILLLVAFFITVPWADTPWPALPVFVPVYNMAIIVLDLLTALLLLAQLRQSQERAFLVLACGYLFTPVLIAAHSLSFPDAFTKGSLIGGSQTTAWLWMGWHGLFPIFVIAYAVLRRHDAVTGAHSQPISRARVVLAVTGTFAVAAGVVLLTTAGEHLLPQLMSGDRYRSSSTRLILTAGWCVHLLGLLFLILFTGMKRLIDAWLAVTLIAYLIDLALSALLVNGRYEAGFYLGRIYGLMAASFVIMVLLQEAITLYGLLVSTADTLRRSEQRFRTLTDVVPQVIWTNDAEGRANYFNRRWYEYTGLSYQQSYDRGWHVILHPDDAQNAIRRWAEALEAKRIFEVEYRLRRADGTFRWHIGRNIPVFGEDGRLQGWFGSATDIHELKALQKQKEDFIGIASHELKTPVTSLKVYTEVLQEKLDANGREEAVLLEKMNGQIDRLTDLIRDLLDTTRITEGQLPLNLEAFDLNALINERVEELQRLSARHRLLFNAEGAGMVTADRERISQVLTNLLSNAVKYSPQGGDVIIKAGATPYDVTVSVTDAGIGIPEHHQNKVFDRFYRVNSAQTQTYPGLGLGLYICSEIIRRHGGSIAVESTEGEGAVFRFSIPCRQQNSAEPLPAT
jgi:PAS domain S-box-containing protein